MAQFSSRTYLHVSGLSQSRARVVSGAGTHARATHISTESAASGRFHREGIHPASPAATYTGVPTGRAMHSTLRSLSTTSMGDPAWKCGWMRFHCAAIDLWVTSVSTGTPCSRIASSIAHVPLNRSGSRSQGRLEATSTESSSEASVPSMDAPRHAVRSSAVRLSTSSMHTTALASSTGVTQNGVAGWARRSACPVFATSFRYLTCVGPAYREASRGSRFSLSASSSGPGARSPPPPPLQLRLMS